ncbi:MAG: hypothetical protein US71_C0002G0035 [Parcubacteria group bacterium GW2011_GWD2_38_12]|nr:MAG: hypothetical protein US06_C0003G0023 [Parcubacteria group bacterium GW2011_GWC2_36_17]KKQ39656.1 MAG: hypothetical protein US56_C0015G0005 [Candidatus Moranbacteria bacterium GW2011_GWF2_37_7]KKQ43705.1 MAG: hypothetical protein US61_C0005G0018 [Parcubacteria group bacterium GW2011_GWE2_37_8]KKQ52638.1 MAG: hypothetical protein US71_C0002G0035 [Parcubacteria group bacterium GW2011_GWD2_38_12]KKQ58843.1 MAG: hypothetical protein US79_C0002G0031 [Parcubacteria group bacterium GW2011_GWC1_
MLKDSLKTTTLSLIILSLIGVVYAWTEPTQTPPDGNTEAPLTTSSIAQTKVGGLWLNTGGAEVGLIVEKGKVGIGTISPSQSLDVSGQIHSSGDICTDVGGGSCLSSLVADSAGETIIHGTINANGTKKYGTGFSSTYNKLGEIYTYTITFTNPFVTVPSITALSTTGITSEIGESVPIIPALVSKDGNGFKIRLYTGESRFSIPETTLAEWNFQAVGSQANLGPVVDIITDITLFGPSGYGGGLSPSPFGVHLNHGSYQSEGATTWKEFTLPAPYSDFSGRVYFEGRGSETQIYLKSKLSSPTQIYYAGNNQTAQGSGSILIQNGKYQVGAFETDPDTWSITYLKMTQYQAFQ